MSSGTQKAKSTPRRERATGSRSRNQSKSKNKTINLETQRGRAATKTFTAEVAGGAEGAEKQRQGGYLPIRKSSRAATILRISTAEEAEDLKGDHRGANSNLSGLRKGFGQHYNPQRPLLPPLPLRFKVYGFDFVLVAAASRCASASPRRVLHRV